ncbi:hypothetical protein [Nocardia alni]|uniref:hypothetical protein n=1 Tax=Nocardia alni TaxID=2815723 RepID=UPI001C22F45F|nr:hypothetical protein [Nocardia alni]
MDTAEIRHALSDARTKPEGQGRTRYLETLAAAARDGGDRLLEAEVLLDLVQAYSHAGERDLTPDAFTRLLCVHDGHPSELTTLSQSVLWYLKWWAHDLIDNPSMPLDTVRYWLDELEQRYRAAGYSLRPVLKLRSTLARELGDYESAAHLRDQALAAPRDHMTDCEACECGWAGALSKAMGDDHDALRRWAPVLEGRRGCAEEPHRIRAHALLPLIRTGSLDTARAAHLTGYPLLRNRPGLRYAIAEHIEFCALTGNEARGLDILTEHAQWLTEVGADANIRLEFATGVSVLLQRLVDLGYANLPVGPDAATCASALNMLTAEIGTLCARYDERNGTDTVSVAVRARLAQKPLADHLPLGIRSTGRLRSLALVHDAGAASHSDVLVVGRAGPVPGASVRATLRTVADPDRHAEAEQLAQAAAVLMAGDPGGAEATLRRALHAGDGVLHPEQLARLSSLLVTAISGQSGREEALADAALTAAWHWEPWSPVDALHHIVVAARAYHRAGRHGEAVALLEQPLSLDHPSLSERSLPLSPSGHREPIGEPAPNSRPLALVRSASPAEVLTAGGLPYPVVEIALIRRQFGDSLNALNRYGDAAAQFTEGARLIHADPRHRDLHAELVFASAAALSVCGRDTEALEAYLCAADLFAELDRVASHARCLRSAAWLKFWGDESGAVMGMGIMWTLLADLERLAENAPSPEVRGELLNTRRQLETMRDEANAK